MSQRSKQQLPGPYEASIHKTEWTCAAKVAEWINEIVKDKNLSLGKAEVETTTELSRERADIIIFKGQESDKALCVIEMKRPYFSKFKETELKELARKKAVSLKAPYFATCDFQLLIWFNTEKANRMEAIDWHDKYELSDIENLDNIEDARFKIPIINGLTQFLRDLVEVYTGKKPEPLLPVDEFLIFYLHNRVTHLAKYYKPIIRDNAHKDTKFKQQLQKWFADQQWQFTWQDSDYEKVARQTAYLLVNKILFYYALKAKRTYLSSLSIPDDLVRGGQLQYHLQGYFNYVLNKIDYETVFSTDFIDQIAFPEHKEIIQEIMELLSVLKRYDYSQIGYDVIGRIFEKLIPLEERHKLGQYFTSPDVVDIILKFCLIHEENKVLDPSCGAGTFLVRAYQHKKIMNAHLEHTNILETLWGVDIAKFPATLSTINLALQDLSVDKNYPNIIQDDFFNLLASPEGLELPDKWRKARAKTLRLEEREVTYPRQFDVIVGNPPYTRQEEIPEITGMGNYKEKLIKNALYDVNEKKIADISKRAGIYTYFFVHGFKFLKESGRFGFIVSKSWLDVDYGKGLQEFFLKNYKVIAIIESKERWFADADINTCIVILQKCDNKKEREENLVRFVYLKKPLSYFIPPTQEMWEKQVERLNEIDKLKKTILAHNEFYENEELRIFPKLQKELWDEGFDGGEYVGAKWGKYIRAPEIFFKILEKCKDKLVPLKEVADVRRGFTTGANEFFYLTEEQIKRKKIEKEFWMHKDKKGNWVPNYVIKSPRECKSIIVNPKDLKYRVLMIHKDKKDLKGTNVLKYIEYGERREFNKRPTCKSRKRWYELPEIKAPLLSKRFVDITFGYFFNIQDLFVGDTFFVSRPKNMSYTTRVAAFLNSTLGSFLTEIYGRTVMGEGVLLIYGPEIIPMPVINPKLISDGRKGVVKKFLTSPVGSIFKELGANSPDEVSLDKVKPERRELDKIIMGDILGLSEDEQLEVYRAVIGLVKSRIEKAKSFGNKKKTKEGIDIESVNKSILARIKSSL